MNKTTSILTRFLFFIFLTLIFSVNAQSTEILESYEDFSEAPREIAYAHLNKSTYIEGEIMGFTAYVFDKFTKEPSRMTSNLYCTISDKNGKLIKEKLIKVQKGVATNAFDIDSTLSTGIFKFKAYTNWMKNFEEQNHFEQTFKVIDADNLGDVKPVSAKDINVDLQALGEGGHLLYNVSNSVGIIAKNQFGYGIANAYGTIKDESGTIISEFRLNDVGLAKTLFTPITGKKYSVHISLNEKEISSPINNIESYGIVMSLVSSSDIVRLQIKTNNESLQRNNRDYKVALHNGSDMVLSDFEVNEKGTAILSFPKDELYKGTNIFTIFSKDNQPLLERLYFNNSSILQKKISKVNVKLGADSLDVSLNLNLTETLKSSNLSVSILPSETKSYNHHNNILSQLFIQPYIKGYIENGSSYFTTNDRKTDYNLDLLMLTQGWSSYSWKTILSNQERVFIYPFERGIDIVANVNKEKPGTYIVYPLANNTTQLFDVPKNEVAFTIKKSFPTNDDLFRIGYVNTEKKEFKEKPSVYLQYYPSEFPDFKNSIYTIDETFLSSDKYISPNQNNEAWANSQSATKLDEVVIKADKRKTRLEALEKKAIGARVDLIQENIKLRNLRLDLYLQRLGWVTQFDYFSGTLSITNPRVNWGDPVPLVYLDNALLSAQGINSDFSILTFLNMQDIDYIEYEFYGSGGGIRGNAGFIKIFSDPNGKTAKKNNKVVTYDVPLRFSKEKIFYTPKYQYYNTDFFKEYGTIDWQPNINVDASGKASFKFYDTKTKEISLFVEGIINEDLFISQEIKIQRDN